MQKFIAEAEVGHWSQGLAAEATLPRNVLPRYPGEPVAFHQRRPENLSIGFEYKIKGAAVVRV